MSREEAKSWASSNVLGVVQLAALAAVFYVSSTADTAARTLVDAHEEDAGHAVLVVAIGENATAIKLLTQRTQFDSDQYRIDMARLLAQLEAYSRKR
ncbi:MAG: hypothetical protein COB66_01300 [Coxiella sp. (in: Bacteria)]|nr:MAG: hypothetical protein COB66_01300 [Coxiella sp. (in: g-proteobacteria)]